ncbi:MAG: M13 family metallopeptidase [Bacteroidales bacterium]|nr:M13 family metallopeptidase [Bacteroidales bacterium]MDD7608991.1 M13 family metallopeptidase [Bacteroidales bacterium]MDY5459179.1 M13 family metallopeptidase [Candidatus Cryptobacteroides sp.]MEE0340769.1 M13 family metallopeptidase [Bacteroidales bacterium]
MKKGILIMSVAIMAAATSCGTKSAGEKVPAIDLANLDPSISAKEDFYQYATGGWQKNHPLKPEYSRYGSFDVLRENNEIRLNELFQGLSSVKAEKGSVQQKISDLYAMGLDSTRLNAEGVNPVKPYLDALESVKDVESYVRAMADIELHGDGGCWGVYAESDMTDNSNTVLYITQSGLALGNRDYYLLAENAELREGYLNFLKKIFTLAGDEKAEQKAKDAFDFQMTIAEPSWSMIQQRDIEARYNPMTPEQLYKEYPALRFDAYLDAMGIPAQSKIVLEQPSYFKALNRILAKTNPRILRHYLQAQLLSGACGYISDDFTDASFDFFSAQMSGIKEQKPRWKRAMQAPNSILGEAVGEMYVAKYFPEKDKQKMLQIVKNIQKGLSEHVASLDWMSEQTKARAQEKLSSFIIKIGYPDKWKDYSTLEIDAQKSYYQNLREASLWSMRDNLSKLGRPVDKTEWGMTPQTVNAYYNPTTNEICFPAGILQPPFFNPNADDAVNYGAIGVVISHEMTHGFDDQGRLFDKDGNLNNWWTEEDAASFKAKADKLVAQFDAVQIQDGLYANGSATLGENIADQGGLRIAFTAMKNSFGGKEPKPIDGFTAEQRFYLAYAILWGQNITPQECARLTLLDVHSLGRNRVNVSLRNLQDFFDAFDIKEGDKMFRPEEERVVIW